jgi:RNA polymerase sigma-70 factor (ECF subfamily)
MSDELLLVGLGAGDPRLTAAFIHRFQRPVFGVALGVIGDHGLAEDIAQQAFERAWRKAASYDRSRGSVRAWLIRITHNLAVDTARVRTPCPIDKPELDSLVTAITETPEGHALAAETSVELRRAIAALSPEQARAVVLCVVHGRTARELAELEAIPLGTAKSRIRAALGTLHELVAHLSQPPAQPNRPGKRCRRPETKSLPPAKPRLAARRSRRPASGGPGLAARRAE